MTEMSDTVNYRARVHSSADLFQASKDTISRIQYSKVLKPRVVFVTREMT